MSWIRRLFQRNRLERELDAEVSYHIERQIQDLIDRGVDPAEAARQVRLSFGSATQIMEATRDARGTAWIEDLGRDIRHGYRLLRRAPAFTAVATLSLALGIGATTAIFTLIDRAILRDLPVREPERLVELIRYRGAGRTNHAHPHFEQLRRSLKSFDDLLAEAWLGDSDISIDGQTEIASVELVSGGYYRVLGVQPAIGRTFSGEADHPPGANPAVISHAYWQRRFGADPAVIGKTFRRLSTTFTIIGVAPRQFSGVAFGRLADITLPVSMVAEVRGGRADDWLRDAARHWLAVMGRLAPGVSRSRAEAEVNTLFSGIAANEARLAPDDRLRNAILSQRMELRPAANGIDDWRRDLEQPLAVLMGTVLLVLLLACANVANLLLTKSAARQREIAVRLAIGAGTGRVVRQMLTEGFLLALAGGALGVVLSYAIASGLVTMMANGGPPIALATTPDARILGFALAVTVVSCVLFSLAPAAQAVRGTLQSTLAETRAARWRLGRGLIVAQMAISVLLLIGAGLFGRTLLEMYSQDSGFRRQGLVLFSTNLARLGYDPERLDPLWERLRTELQALPGVQMVTMSTVPPVSGGSGWDAKVRVEGYSHGPNESNVSHGNRVGPQYFRTYGTPLVSGRDFEESDRLNSEPVAIVNESFARDYFKGESALGKRIGPDYPGLTGWFRIVGVVRDMKYGSMRQDAPRAVYFPMTHLPTGNATFAIRTERSASALASEIQAAVLRVDDAGRAQGVRSMETHVARSLLTERILAWLGAFFGALALLLGAIGIYGVMAYQVARRRREIGIRMALGARAGTVVAMILRQTARLTLLGSAIGVVGGLALAKLAKGFLFRIQPNDPITYSAAIGSLLLVALAAACLPARRAARTSPVETLRTE